MARANESSLSALDERVGALPTSPGVYLFKSARGRVLYVGKAQNLRGRVRSYLRPGGDGRIRVPALVEGATDVEVVVTPSVKAALLLENELIKRHKPPFNVRLRDDKQYLGLRVDVREPWPRPTPVRRFREDGAAYFGPYTSSVSLRDAISNLRRIFPLRSCSDPVFRDYARRGRPCIEFEMKRCLAPCCGGIDAESYAKLVEGTVLFLRGRSDQLLQTLRGEMERAAAGERFEDAARLRDRIDREAGVAQRRGRDTELSLAAVHDQQIGQRIVVDLREPPCQHLAQAREVVAGGGLADPVAAVAVLVGPPIDEDDAARDRVRAGQRGHVVALDAPR